jgi:hypothetical protein
MDEPIEIPPELLLPTVEELEARNREDAARSKRARKRPGKKERAAKKRDAERAKFQKFAQEFDTQASKPAAAPQAPAAGRVLRGSFGAVKGAAGVTAKATLFDPSAPAAPAPKRPRGRPPKIRPLF